MRIFCSLTENYVFSLMLLAVATKILLLPLNIKKRKSEIKKTLLQPYVKNIEEKYKDKTDKETVDKKNIEITALYKSEGVGLATGCLLALLPLFIFFIIYRVITHPLDCVYGFSDKTIEAITTIASSITGKDVVSQIEMLSVLKHNVGEFSAIPEVAQYIVNSFDCFPETILFNGIIDAARTPFFSPISIYAFVPLAVFIATLLITITTSFAQKQQTLSFKNKDQRIQSLLLLFSFMLSSAMLAFVSVRLPVAISIYWVFNSLLDSIQNLALSKMVNAKNTTIKLQKYGE